MSKVRSIVGKSGGKKRGRVVMFRVGRIDDAEGAREFDRVFWRRVGARGRFAIMWSMIQDYYRFKGKNACKPRLRRTVENFQQAQG